MNKITLKNFLMTLAYEHLEYDGRVPSYDEELDRLLDMVDDGYSLSHIKSTTNVPNSYVTFLYIWYKVYDKVWDFKWNFTKLIKRSIKK